MTPPLLRAILAVAIAGTSSASVLSSKHHGPVLVRAACLHKEVRVDPAQLGATGPQGAPGPPGAPATSIQTPVGPIAGP